MDTLRRLLWLKDYAAEQNRTAPKKPMSIDHVERPNGAVIRHLSFAYPGTSRAVLGDVSLEACAGAVVAIVGENGAGKSTLAKLLAGMYPIGAGEATIGGYDVTAVSPSDWQGAIGAVFQDFTLPYLSLREAVAIGAGGGHLADDSSVLAALHTAGGADLIERLGSLDAQLGPMFGGSDLSRGEWQKLAIARAALRESPPVLILDEPSASLDPLSEAAIFDRFDSLIARTSAAGGLTIFISHRLALVTAADLVLYMRDGRIVAQGGHEELRETVPEYAELFELQARSYR